MKLRNKKTGEIWDIGKVLVNDYPCWETLTQICEDWEDVKDPLIKDEKVRKAVRAWAEAECITKAYLENDYTICRDDDVDVSISFCVPVFKDVVGASDYTLAELCGEEEG